jgi:hypothetical protein
VRVYVNQNKHCPISQAGYLRKHLSLSPLCHQEIDNNSKQSELQYRDFDIGGEPERGLGYRTVASHLIEPCRTILKWSVLVIAFDGGPTAPLQCPDLPAPQRRSGRGPPFLLVVSVLAWTAVEAPACALRLRHTGKSCRAARFRENPVATSQLSLYDPQQRPEQLHRNIRESNSNGSGF